jgi:23S rRNA pseudouridine1911/1915/1917 synthase
MNQGYEYRERVAPGEEGETLLAYLERRYPHSSARQWELRILSGDVLLDNLPAQPGDALRGGELLTWRRPGWEEPPAPLSFALLHRDPDLLAILKPAGLPTLPGGGYLEHTLLALLRRSYPEASPAHRIGRPTTGLVLCSRNRATAARLGQAWREGRVRKLYRAVVSGVPRLEAFTIDVAIGPVPHRSGEFRVHAASPVGRPSLSHVRLLEERGQEALVEIEIVTGRPHQARIHLAASGHPLAGDPFYGAGGLPRPGTAALPGDGGFLLHSHRLLLAHPSTGSRLELEAPPPRPLRRAQEA